MYIEINNSLIMNYECVLYVDHMMLNVLLKKYKLY